MTTIAPFQAKLCPLVLSGDVTDEDALGVVHD